MKVLLRNPPRELDVEGPTDVSLLLRRLDLSREAHLVIEDGTLVPNRKMLGQDAVVEVRSFMSGASR